MDLKVRLNVVLGTCAAVAVGIAAAVMNFDLQRSVVAEVQREAELHMEAAQALRRYTSEHIRPLLTRDATVFHPESVPSFSASTTMRDMHTRYTGVSYREVALNPTNPANLATGVMAEIVKTLRDTTAGSLLRQVSEPGGEFLYFAKPLRVNSASCLVCHSSPQAAPPAMLAKYGDKHGFGWQFEEVVGAQIVKVPMAMPMANAHRALVQFLLGASAIVVAVFLALNAMLRQVLLNPITSQNDDLRREAREDGLTGAVNRRGFLEFIEQTLARAREPGKPVSVVMIDVDHFKTINDTHGHAAGDTVLRELVRRVLQRVRRGDVLGRLGGDEFGLLLPDTEQAAAARVARALLEGLQEAPYADGLRVGFSMGVAQWDGAEESAELIKRADDALYAAKREGRAQVVSFEAPSAT